MNIKFAYFTYCWFLISFLCTDDLKAQEITLENWLTIKHGRTQSLFGTANKNKILNSFIPSGDSETSTRIKDWEILIRHGVYYSNEENPDTSKDKPASVIVYHLENDNKQPHFAGKGYKFFLIKEPDTKQKPLFIVRYWSGAMGCSFIDLSFFENQRVDTKPVIEYRSSVDDRIGEICEAPIPSNLFLSD